jgi:hypothetical protein
MPSVIEPELADGSLLKIRTDLAFREDVDDPLRHRSRVGRAEEQGQFRGRIQAMADRGNL